MSVEEMKKAIHQEIDNLSPDQLRIVDEFIKKVRLNKKDEWDITAYAESIIDERAELLKKLAQ